MTLWASQSSAFLYETRGVVRGSLVGDDQVIADREVVASVMDAGETAPAQ